MYFHYGQKSSNMTSVEYFPNIYKLLKKFSEEKVKLLIKKYFNSKATIEET